MSQTWEAVIAAAFSWTGLDGVVTVERGVQWSDLPQGVEWSGQRPRPSISSTTLTDTFEKDGQVYLPSTSWSGTSSQPAESHGQRIHTGHTLAESQDYYSGPRASVDTDPEFVAIVSSA